MTSDIVLTVDEGQAADAARFFAAGACLLGLLDDLAETADVEWAVSELRTGSAVSGLSASGENKDAGIAAAHSVVDGLTRVREGSGPPESWNPNAIIDAKDLVRKSGGQAKLQTAGNVVWLDQTLRARLESVIPWVREYYGSVRGQLTGVNVTRGNRASIRAESSGRVVHVGFPNALAETMRDGLLQFVEVEGIARQNDQGRIYYVTAEHIRVIEPATISWRELRGLMPDITGGLSVAEYLEDIRGED